MLGLYKDSYHQSFCHQTLYRRIFCVSSALVNQEHCIKSWSVFNKSHPTNWWVCTHLYGAFETWTKHVSDKKHLHVSRIWTRAYIKVASNAIQSKQNRAPFKSTVPNASNATYELHMLSNLICFSFLSSGWIHFVDYFNLQWPLQAERLQREREQHPVKMLNSSSQLQHRLTAQILAWSEVCEILKTCHTALNSLCPCQYLVRILG